MTSPADSESLYFDVYGYRFRLAGSAAEAIAGVASDFAFFRAAPSENAVQIDIFDDDPPYDELPPLEASGYSPRNVVYRDGELSYIDYRGKCLAVHHRKTGDFRVLTRDRHLQYETVYLFLLAQAAAYLDERGMHRVHALAVSVGGRAVLALLPMGGGKSTLGGTLLACPDVKILSDDSPFIDRRGTVYAYPLHLGLLPGGEHDIPREHQRFIQRMEFGPKILVNYEYYAGRVAPQAQPGLILLGRRSLSRECRIERAGLWAGLRAMGTNCVVGLGLFQGIEFLLQSSFWELLGKVKVVSSRLRNSWRLLRRSEIYVVWLGRDLAVNARRVAELARERLAAAK